MEKRQYWPVLVTAVLCIVMQVTNFAFAQAVTTVTAVPDPETEQLYYLKNAHFGDVLGHATNNPSTVDIHAMHTTGKESKWIIKEDRPGVFKIYSAKDPRMVLQARNNNSVIVALGSGSRANNLFWKKVNTLRGTFKLQNMQYTDKVLDASAGTRGKVQLWGDVGNSNQYVPNADNQRWTLIPIVRATVSGPENGAPRATATVTATVTNRDNTEPRPSATVTTTTTNTRPRATVTGTVTVTQRPTSVSGVNCNTDSPEVLAGLLAYLYDKGDENELSRLMECLPCSRLSEVLYESPGVKRNVLSNINRRSSKPALNYIIKRKLLDCKQIDFSFLTDDEINRYFGEIAGSQFCAKVNSFTTNDYIGAVRVYFQLHVDLGLPEKTDYLNPFFIPFPKITGFNDADEQTMLRILRCLSRQKFNDLVNYFSYREFDYRFDGSENTEFQQLYDRHNPERYAKWGDDETRVFLMTKTCNQINALNLVVIRDLILNLFDGHTDEAEETAIIKVIDCLPANKVKDLIIMQGTFKSDFLDEFQGRNEDLLKAAFARKGVRF